MSKTAQELRQEAAEHETRAAESYERSGTEGFVSQWASGLSAQEKRLQAQIQEEGGVATFFRYELETLEGEKVRAKLISGRFGPCWALLQEGSEEFTGEFVGAHPVRASTLERKGYRETKVEFVAEAKAKMIGSGTGLSGAASVRVYTVPVEREVEYHGVACIGQYEEEES